MAQPEDPEFGPSGYLPPRAAQRARKIVLRERMGLGWPLAAVVVMLAVVIFGAAFLMSRGSAPEAPFVAIAPLAEVPQDGSVVIEVDGEHLLLIRAGDAVTALRALEGAELCQESGRIEGPDGAVWTLDGRRVGGSGESLPPVPAVVYQDTVYADRTASRAALAPDDRGLEPVC